MENHQTYEHSPLKVLFSCQRTSQTSKNFLKPRRPCSSPTVFNSPGRGASFFPRTLVYHVSMTSGGFKKTGIPPVIIHIIHFSWGLSMIFPQKPSISFVGIFHRKAPHLPTEKILQEMMKRVSMVTRHNFQAPKRAPKDGCWYGSQQKGYGIWWDDMGIWDE